MPKNHFENKQRSGTAGRWKRALLLVLPLLLVSAVLLPRYMDDGTEGMEGMAAQLAHRVLESTDFACRKKPLDHILALHLRLDTLFLKNVARTQEALQGAGRNRLLDAPRPPSTESERHYYFDARVQAYTLFGVPSRIYELSGDEENIQVWCQGRPD